MTTPDNESLLKYPCDFSIKVIGAATQEFENEIRAIVKKHLPNTDITFKMRASNSGNYTAATITFIATSKEQLDRIYQDFSASKEVIMAL